MTLVLKNGKEGKYTEYNRFKLLLGQSCLMNTLYRWGAFSVTQRLSTEALEQSFKSKGLELTVYPQIVESTHDWR